MKKLIVFLFAVSFLGTSCKKDLVEKYEKAKDNGVAKVTQTKDVKVSDNFAWSTSKEVQVQINPNSKGLLLIQSAEGEVFYKAFINSGNVFTAKFILQNKNEKMFIYFNGNQEEVPVTTGLKYVSQLK